jgi:hypothetical protein
VKTDGTKVCRKDPRRNQELDIFVYSYKYESGICFLYENSTSNMTLDESITFKTSGLQLVGHDGNQVKVYIGPGESKFIELQSTMQNWSIQTSISYTIS